LALVTDATQSLTIEVSLQEGGYWNELETRRGCIYIIINILHYLTFRVLESGKLVDLNHVHPGLGPTGLSDCLITQHGYTYSVRLVKLLHKFHCVAAALLWGGSTSC
jgi:hypothetical protein